MRKIWPQTPTGTYLVKSGYRFLSQEGLLPDQQRAHTGQVQALWKQVWGLQVPNRVRNFICWACRNTIPTKTNVVWRQILNEDICEQWHQHAEDVLHALWSCPSVSGTWDSDPSWRFLGSHQFSSFVEVVQEILDSGSPLDEFAMLVWTIWFHNNQLRMSSGSFLINQVQSQAMSALHEFIQARPTPITATTRCPPASVRWSPSPKHLVKVNYDRATFQDLKKASFRAVIRNHLDLILASMTNMNTLPPLTDTVECMVAVRAFRFATTRHARHVSSLQAFIHT